MDEFVTPNCLLSSTRTLEMVNNLGLVMTFLLTGIRKISTKLFLNLLDSILFK